MLRLKSILCCLVLLSLAFPLGNAWAKKPRFNKGSVSAITLDVVRMEACAGGKGCTVASGPMQLDLLELADGMVDFANQVLLPENTKELRFVLGDNNTITVDEESFPLITPHDLLKLKGQKIFGQEDGFLTNLTLDLDLSKQLSLRKKKIGFSGKGKSKKITFAHLYKLRQNIRVESAEITPMTEDTPAVMAMPDEDKEITIGDKFSLVIPAGAVSEPMVISVKETKYTVEVMDEETGEVIEKPALSSNYELSPDGAEFGEPLVVTLPYSPETLPSDVSEYDLAVYLDAEKIPTDINTMSKTATADVWHFTNATVSSPQVTGNFVFPFEERDKVWQICQGYNTPEITHGSSLIHSFDFAYGSDNTLRSDKGCSGNPGGSEDKTVVAPAEGMILWNGTNDKDITCFQLKVPVSNGHGVQIGSIKLGHMKNNSARMSADPKSVLAQGTPIGKVCGPTGCDSSGPYAHIHMAAYPTTNCTGVTVPFGTIFGGSDPDFRSDGSKYQWHGEELSAVNVPASPVVNYVEPPEAVLNRTTTFTVHGEDLPPTLEFLLTDCTGVQSLGGSSTARQFSCTPRTSGQKDGIIELPGGAVLKTFTVNVIEESSTLPVVDYVTPPEAVLGEPTIFTVSGQNLPSTLEFLLTDCTGVQSQGGSSTAMRFSCTPRTAGQKYGIIEQSGGAVLKTFTVNVIEESSTLPVVDYVTPPEAVLNRATTFTVYGEDLPSTLEFLLTDCTGVQSLGGSSTAMRFSCTPRTSGQKEGIIEQSGGAVLKRFTVDVIEEPATLPVINSVTPREAVLDEPTIFTVNGQNLPSTLAFWIGECANLEKVGGDSSTSMMFRCLPSWTAGWKDGVVKDEPGGTELYSFQVNVVDDNEPVVTSVSPAAATLGVATDFTVMGQNMPSTLAFFIEECADLQSLGGSSTYKQFRCTPSYTLGTKNGVIKDQPGGTVLKEFTVDVADAPADDEILLAGVRVNGNQDLYENSTARYTAEACLFNRADIDDPSTELDEAKTYTKEACFSEQDDIRDVTAECTWKAYPTKYVTSLGGGQVEALSGSYGATAKVSCKYYHSPSNRNFSGTLSVTVK